ncbi:hypothetical protein CCACVL1_02482 [Corchorus capsularis]|uniref:Uncharacterized protein n=1 Tax=Corchorus capsularis TaxID=210143 RepID=A0A1R3K872_COCAP|nr:hypothetical protein CCACVL1_02482 [Corchorus capsularis]
MARTNGHSGAVHRQAMASTYET